MNCIPVVAAFLWEFLFGLTNQQEKGVKDIIRNFFTPRGFRNTASTELGFESLNLFSLYHLCES